ncbi:NADH-quinone oxidoreductase subunit J [Actinomycetaceae bacterium TAE3-ERU4]|nr:NADH-quinone oxidoreductase subunit J [Actinomycetaceae bacterium TAE3-ERU4]
MRPLLAAADLGINSASPGEFIKFSILAVFMILCAIGVARFKRAAYAAICMIGVMIGFALAYLLNGAEFMGIVQVVVYTGAVMMLFLFVLMLIGIGASDNYRSGSSASRVASYLFALALVALLGTSVWFQFGARQFAPPQNPAYNSLESLGMTLFQGHAFTVLLSAILLITAALGALLLTHSDRLTPKRSQRQVAEAKMVSYAVNSRHPGQLPPPGVYAESNAFDVPAISGQTHAPIEESVPRVLRAKGINRSVGEVSPWVAAHLLQTRKGDPALGLHGGEATRSVGQSGSWGMPGVGAPHGLNQPGAAEVKPLDSDVTEESEDKE